MQLRLKPDLVNLLSRKISVQDIDGRNKERLRKFFVPGVYLEDDGL